MKKLRQLIKFGISIILIFIITEVASGQTGSSSMVVLGSIGIKVKQLPGWTIENGEGYAYYRSPNQDINMVIIADPNNTMQYYSEILPSGVPLGGGETVYSDGEIQAINQSSSHVQVLYTAPNGSATGWLGMKQTIQHGVVAFLVFSDGITSLYEAKTKMLEVMASCTEISNSVQSTFQKGNFGNYSSPLLQQWHQELVHSRLTYFSTYSSGYDGGGMISKRTIDLCRDGSFAKNYEGNTSINTSGASYYNNIDNSNYGRWSLRLQDNKPVLTLTPQQGNVMEYWLSFENGKLYLDNDRYFLIHDDSEDGPRCD